MRAGSDLARRWDLALLDYLEAAADGAQREPECGFSKV
jgi:hypothetical protein